MTLAKDVDLMAYEAILFDLDGVLTATARVHSACWKKMFDEFLRANADETDTPFVPFDRGADYLTYVDGKPRMEGVQSFLESRGIHLPFGTHDDPPEMRTVCGLGNRKNELFRELLSVEGADVFEGSVTLARRLRQAEKKMAVVSSSKNCMAILEVAGLKDLFDYFLDGNEAQRLQLAGKPQPDTFLKAAEMLGVAPQRAVVVEDAISGVQAGRAGNFGLVIGVDRHGTPQDLLDNGADIVVGDLAEFL
ncbi:MAG: beta-phosphoglucomutase family hydrolase [Desulfuromonadaceae bacterium]|nr:beta-phosphoglucomutase family hydrolase [Desulfuromonadaceae bacterium]